MLPLLHLERERVERERGVTGAEETLIKERALTQKEKNGKRDAGDYTENILGKEREFRDF